MVRKILYMVSAVVLAGVATLSCKDEDFGAWEEGGTVLSAYKEKVISRAGEVYNFSEGTKYRIWVNDATTEQPVFDGQAAGMEGTEAIRQDGLHYINLGDYNNRLVGDYDFYGLTDSTRTAPAATEDGIYSITMNDQNNYTDYRRGELQFDANREDGAVLRMPFKHIMSQVRVKVMCQQDITSELTLKKVEFIGANTGEPLDDTKGVVLNAKYNVFSNTFSEQTRGIRTIDLGENVINIPNVGSTFDAIKDAADVGTLLFFPEEQTDETYYMRVTIDDSENLYQLGATNAVINIPIYDNREETTQALHFEQNTSYTLYITFLNSTARIVTLVPKVYDWLDGETDKQDGTGYYEELDFGQPVTFNGVMWSDRNVGATSAYPTRSMDDWNRSVGYFYQYGRSIPYFPNNLKKDGTVDYDTPLNEALAMDETVYVGTGNAQEKMGGLIYPVVNYESWGTTAEAQKNRIAPLNNNSNYSFIRKLGETVGYNSYWGFVYDNYNLVSINEGWDRGHNTPCPPGWRLPTTDDFMGIIPGSGYSGNITFRIYSSVGDNGSWQVDDAYTEPDFENVFSKDNISNIKGISGGPTVKESVYKGFFPCIFREENDDPVADAKSQYILSMRERDWNKVKQTSGDIRSNPGFVYNWGAIYGIKNVGTASAYRVKWEVRLQSDATPWTDGSGALVYNQPFRGILVISRYQTTEYDSFEPDDNDSYESALDEYDWDNPVEQLMLPIGGYVDSWSKGHLGNIGTEAWYAISNRDGISINDNDKKNIFWFKYCGANSASQSAVISNKSLMSAAVQVRCVRDLGNR